MLGFGAVAQFAIAQVRENSFTLSVSPAAINITGSSIEVEPLIPDATRKALLVGRRGSQGLRPPHFWKGVT